MKLRECKCGGTPEIVKIFPKNRYDCFVRCPICCSETKCYTSRQNAVKAWNDGRLYESEEDQSMFSNMTLEELIKELRWAFDDAELVLEAARRLESLKSDYDTLECDYNLFKVSAHDVLEHRQREIFEEIDESTKYFHIPNGCAIISLEKLNELKKKYGVDQNG